MSERSEPHCRPAGLSRRGFLARSAGLALLASAGCDAGTVAGGAPVLRFWNGFTGPDGTTLLKVIKRFNKAREGDVQITMQRTVWDTYYNKLFVAGLGGRAPEVFVVQIDHLERFIWGGLVEPLDDLFRGSGALDETDFDAKPLAAVRRGATTWGLPLDVHPMGLFYNKALFDDVGISGPPRDRAAFLDACAKLKKGGGGGTQWGFVFEWLRINLYGLMRQFDARVIADDLRTVVLDSPESRAALTFASDLINELGLASPIQNTNAAIGFRQGRVGMVWFGAFMLNELLKSPELPWAPAVMPVLGDRPATWAGSHVLCLRRGMDERQRTAALQFVRFLSDNSLDWAEAGQIPIRPSLRDTDQFRAMPMQSTFAQMVPYGEFMPSTTFTREYQIAFDFACEQILRASATPETALKNASREIERAAARFAPKAGAA